jgi:hypothetical protein
MENCLAKTFSSFTSSPLSIIFTYNYERRIKEIKVQRFSVGWVSEQGASLKVAPFLIKLD